MSSVKKKSKGFASEPARKKVRHRLDYRAVIARPAVSANARRMTVL